MHIIKKENKERNISSDHTRIINEIDSSLEIHNWKFILSFLPADSFLVGGYIRDLILGKLNPPIDVDIVVPKSAIEIGKKIAENIQGKLLSLIHI